LEGRRHLYSFTGIATAGFCVRWFRDELGAAERERAEETGEDAYRLLDGMAEEVPPGSDGLIFMPHMMVGERAPYWDEHLRGGLLGLTVYHTRAHIFRAILEGVAYAMRYSLEAAWETGMRINRATLVDGGARSPLWRQIIADVTGLRMSYIPGSQGAPLGDAMLAGLGTEAVSGPSVMDEWIPERIEMRPDPLGEKTYGHYYDLYKAALEASRAVFSKY